MPAARGNRRHRRRDVARPQASRPDLRPRAACGRGAHHACGFGRPRALQTSSCPTGSPNVFVAELPAFPCLRVPGHSTTQPLRTEGAIVTVGRFAPYKGIDQLCDALAELLEQRWRTPARRRRPGPVPPSLRRLERAWPSLVTFATSTCPARELHDVLTIVRRLRDAVPQRHAVRTAVARAAARRAPDRDRRRLHRQLGPAAGRAASCAPGRSSELVDALLEPPSAWTDVGPGAAADLRRARGPLLEWYPTLSAR